MAEGHLTRLIIISLQRARVGKRSQSNTRGTICKSKKLGLLIKIIRFFCILKKESMSKTDNKIVCRVAQEIEHLSMNLLRDNLS